MFGLLQRPHTSLLFAAVQRTISGRRQTAIIAPEREMFDGKDFVAAGLLTLLALALLFTLGVVADAFF